MGKENQRAKAMKTEAIRLKELDLRQVELRELSNIGKILIASPIVQMLGTVLIAETAEKAGILSERWAGALEGGVIAMIGLQALKDYGVLGAGALGVGLLTGSKTQEEATALSAKNIIGTILPFISPFMQL